MLSRARRQRRVEYRAAVRTPGTSTLAADALTRDQGHFRLATRLVSNHATSHVLNVIVPYHSQIPAVCTFVDVLISDACLN
jgi:hypothetical protein